MSEHVRNVDDGPGPRSASSASLRTRRSRIADTDLPQPPYRSCVISPQGMPANADVCSSSSRTHALDRAARLGGFDARSRATAASAMDKAVARSLRRTYVHIDAPTQAMPPPTDRDDSRCKTAARIETTNYRE